MVDLGLNSTHSWSETALELIEATTAIAAQPAIATYFRDLGCPVLWSQHSESATHHEPLP